jgi:beta-carotene hydroxylase
MYMKNHLDKTLDIAALAISKKHSGKIAVPTIILSVLTIFLYSIVLFLFANNFLSPLLTVPLLAVLTFISYTPMHEAVHRNVGGKNKRFKWMDKVVGYLMAPIIAIPFTSHQKEHFTHHVHTNKDKDPDVHIKNWFNSPKHFFMGSLRIIKTQNTFVMNNFTRVEIFISLGWRLLFVLYTGLMSIPVLFLGWFFGAFLTLYLLSYLPHRPYKETARYKNTNIRLFPIQWVENLMFQHNLHAVHHLFPMIPFYNYRKVFQKIKPIMRAKGTPIITILNQRAV